MKANSKFFIARYLTVPLRDPVLTLRRGAKRRVIIKPDFSNFNQKKHGAKFMFSHFDHSSYSNLNKRVWSIKEAIFQYIYPHLKQKSWLNGKLNYFQRGLSNLSRNRILCQIAWKFNLTTFVFILWSKYHVFNKIGCISFKNTWLLANYHCAQFALTLMLNQLNSFITSKYYYLLSLEMFKWSNL